MSLVYIKSQIYKLILRTHAIGISPLEPKSSPRINSFQKKKSPRINSCKHVNKLNEFFIEGIGEKSAHLFGKEPFCSSF